MPKVFEIPKLLVSVVVITTKLQRKTDAKGNLSFPQQTCNVRNRVECETAHRRSQHVLSIVLNMFGHGDDRHSVTEHVERDDSQK